MTIWFISQPAATDPGNDAVKYFVFDASGLPDLSRAESVEHLKEWLRIALPQAIPEHISAQAEYFWTLSHAISENDHVLVHMEGTHLYRLGEVSRAYHYESTRKLHMLGIEWIHTQIETANTAAFAICFKPGAIMEITDPDVIARLHRHIPSLRRIGPVIFRWVAIATLVSELIYFWPR